MTNDEIKEVANELNQARVNAKPVTQFSDRFSEFTRPEAYEVQELGVKFRQSQGETVIGLKMGLTSEAKRKQMNLDAPLYGVLTNKMQVKAGGAYEINRQIHPKIEPEVAFSISKELSGDVSRDEVIASCDGVYAALEILDSRYEHFKYFSMEDVIADNSSSSQFILSKKNTNFDFSMIKDLKMKMLVDGNVAEEGNSSAISGDPVLSVIQLCELLVKRGQKLPAGSIVLAGAATTAVKLQSGMNIELQVDGFEAFGISVK